MGVLIAGWVALAAPSATARRPVAPKAARRWVLTAAPISPRLDTLAAVDCSSARACMAVGSGAALGGVAADSWDGKHWRLVGLPTPAQTTTAELDGVSCVSPGTCEAVGFADTGSFYAGSMAPLAERFSGGKWKLQRVPLPGVVASLAAVSCAASNACMAVGSSGADDLDQALLAERWNGKRWAPVAMGSPGSVDEIELSSVSCPAANDCIAVGDYAPPGLHQVPLAERWNGRSWSIERTVDPNRRADTILSSVSCPSRRQCDAVGNYLAPGSPAQVPVGEHRRGGRWSSDKFRGSSPMPVSSASLAGVSCLPAGPCTAVGTTGATGPGGPAGQTLAERWAGVSWSEQTTPSPAPSDDLLAVSCPSTSACVAVGDESDMDGDNPKALIEHLS